jgi:diacylglycerol kinase (ATP)
LDFKQRIKSFGFAIKGIKTLVKTQVNARIHLFAMVCVTIASWYFSITTTEWCLVIFAFATVLAAEAFNTAIEFVVDLVSPDYHPLAGMAKDVAAAAVLLTAIGSAIIGMIIFIPKVLTFLNS